MGCKLDAMTTPDCETGTFLSALQSKEVDPTRRGNWIFSSVGQST